MSSVLWAPAPAAFESSNLARFCLANGFDPRDYETLHRWSVSDLGAFWRAVWDFGRVIGDPGARSFLRDDQAPMTRSRFFPDASLNVAENLLRGDDDRTAVLETDESGHFRTFTLGDLRRRVARTARGLRAAGVASGDSVGGILPNRVEGLVALLATLSIGAVWSSCSPDFGAAAIVDRLGQIGVKVLFAAPRYHYAGKRHDISERLAEIAAAMPTVATLVLTGEPGAKPDCAAACIAFDDFGSDGTLAFERVPFDHPAYVLYTSGTTGAPKAIVHRAGGVLLQHLKEHLLHGDVRPGDVMSWYTNTAWMMYHWLSSGLACGATVVLYDGAPILKTAEGLDPSPLWTMAERARVTHFGTSPKYLATLAAEGYAPGRLHDLSSLRSLLSAGAPVSPSQFDWVYAQVKREMIFASISGGTEIIGCFLLGSPIHAIRRGELTVKGLGLAVAVMDERNAPVIGRQGDLVCTEPFPSMPLTFWGEDGDARYHATYFAARREIWTHGDVAEMTAHGSGIIHGRSDTTLKPGGVRIGTAEIYAACETFAEIEDCLVFGAPVEGDEEIVLCVKLNAGFGLTSELAARIRRAIRHGASPRHVPHRIHAVQAVPYTLNGKRVEGAARTTLEGKPVKNIASLANPACLQEYRALDRSKAA
ncbi:MULTISPECIES: acetoacetate--CoA ligase [unclassified Mesorhizobium]|uniref:acetoacetate--CoA ligase n=1 Tax=unclassified Mesorhizobium TaxID=325217 RepID=UPI001CCA40A1|nr:MULTISPECIES: acetoacetate--CoA ligase [unclassified Mesorhizobium]MBZ9742681.1 acetoacetate--CoA ligase [Mesorhizobium sp. CO1-1-4]MBZ9801073.1 acetoacetate--CoA ligase [Mesorhizobium sp. ES1-6]